MNRTFNVLLVEDDPILGEVAVEALALLGHRVTWVTTAAAAFDALRISHSLEVVLLDLRLGEVSGETIFEKLQLLEHHLSARHCSFGGAGFGASTRCSAHQNIAHRTEARINSGDRPRATTCCRECLGFHPSRPVRSRRFSSNVEWLVSVWP